MKQVPKTVSLTEDTAWTTAESLNEPSKKWSAQGTREHGGQKGSRPHRALDTSKEVWLWPEPQLSKVLEGRRDQSGSWERRLDGSSRGRA